MSADLETRERLAQLARAGRTDDLLALLGERSPDLTDGKGDSLLMLAAYYGNAETVTALLGRGAKVSGRNERALSVLDGAAFKGEIAVIDALLDGGADVNEAGPDGRTPLMWAAAFDRVDAVRRLVERGADPGRLDVTGKRAVDHARMMGAGRTPGLLGDE